MKILLGGLVAGIVVFLWSALAHMALPIGTMGVKTLPNEGLVVDAMKGANTESGLYFFPGLDMRKKPTPEEQKDWEARYRSGPVGILVYQAEGQQPLSPKQLLIELVSNIAAAWVAAIVLSQTGGGLLGRALLVALLGMFGWFSISVSNWNWYGFPGAYIAGEAIDQIVGWFLGGLVLAGIVKKAAG